MNILMLFISSLLFFGCYNQNNNKNLNASTVYVQVNSSQNSYDSISTVNDNNPINKNRNSHVVEIVFEANNLKVVLEGENVFLNLDGKNYLIEQNFYIDSVLPHFAVTKNELHLNLGLIAQVLGLATLEYYDNKSSIKILTNNKVCSNSTSISFRDCGFYLIDINNDNKQDIIYHDSFLSGNHTIVYSAYIFNKKEDRFIYKEDFFNSLAFYGFDKTGKYLITYKEVEGHSVKAYKNISKDNRLLPIDSVITDKSDGISPW